MRVKAGIWHHLIRPGSALCVMLLAGCATAPLTQTGALTSYADLKRSDGIFTHTRLRVDRERLAAVRTVRLAPAAISTEALFSGLSESQLHLVANAVDRALCSGLSDRFTIVEANDPADLSVRTTITYVHETSVAASSASLAIGAGATVAGAITGVRIPTVRLPLGLGALSVEAEADTSRSRQVAAMEWSRGADVVTSRPRVSEDADAYLLGKEFAADFTKLLVKGEDPIRNPLPAFPTMRSIKEFFGAPAQQAACAKFGRDPGINDLIGGAIGLPPRVTDSGGVGEPANEPQP
jgi:hypothetical protein